MISKNTYPRKQAIGGIHCIVGRSTTAYYIFMKKCETKVNWIDLEFITLSNDLERILLLKPFEYDGENDSRWSWTYDGTSPCQMDVITVHS